MRLFSRRDFLQHSSALAAFVAGGGLAIGHGLETLLEPSTSPKSKAVKKGEANDRLRVAVMGVNGRGMSHVHAFAGNQKLNTMVTTICDADFGVVGSAMTHVLNKQGFLPRYESDIRKVLEDKSIDIVSIATPNHWHALAAIWALQAGKDVYVEKPVSHNVSEGRRIVETARATGRICQSGTQSRSSTGMREAMDFLHAGKLGKVKVARGLCYKRRGSIGKVSEPTPLPKTVDYDLWCGPAPKKALMRKNLHYDWHWIWDYGNGDLGNQGIHEMDKARWGLGKNELAKAVLSVGGRFGYVDDGETANTQICVFDYGDSELIFEVRGLASTSPYPETIRAKDKKSKRGDNFVGNIFHCTEGLLVCPSYTAGVALRPDGEVIREFKGGDDHFANFLKAVRSRKASDLHADILEGHLSSALCHLGNISYRLGASMSFDKVSKTFGDDKEAALTLEHMEAHLKDAGVAMDDAKLRVGRKLRIDPKTETFLDDKEEANPMLTREYRKGFEVPAKV
jgi:predicted dehydrogenase